MLEVLKNIKLAIGVISTIAIIISAFKFEILNSDNEYFNDNNLVIDKQIVDTMAKFDRNIRHLQLKGKETSKNDCIHILPDFKEAVSAASRIVYEYRKLLSNQNDWKKSKRGKNRKTISYSLQIGSKIYMISFYWPKLLEVFLGSND